MWHLFFAHDTELDGARNRKHHHKIAEDRERLCAFIQAEPNVGSENAKAERVC